MLIKFTTGGRGSGRQVADYLTDAKRPARGPAAPEVVRGDMARTRELIDSIARKWTYTHGVLSFALEDAPSEAEQVTAMDEFERLAFAGLDREQYDITWVRHQHTEGGRVELHFVVPRMDLASGKALNIAPPGWESTYAPLRDALNWKHGWARPDDPERATELQRAPKRESEGFSLREGREGVHGYLTALVVTEQVTDRATLVLALEEAGLEVPRQGRDYVTVLDPESGDRLRLKGRIYEKEWTYDRELDRAVAKEIGKPVSRDREHDLNRAAEARHELAARIRSRAAFHTERYPRHDQEAEWELETSAEVRKMVVGRADRDLVNDREYLRLALDARGTDLSDNHDRRADISSPARRGRSDNLHEGGLSLPLPEAAEREIDHGPADSLRARLARQVRDISDSLKQRTERLKKHIGEVAGLVRRHAHALGEDRGEAARDRMFSREIAESLERAERANRELTEANGRIAQRIRDMTEEDPRALSLDYPDPKPSWAR